MHRSLLVMMSKGDIFCCEKSFSFICELEELNGRFSRFIFKRQNC